MVLVFVELINCNLQLNNVPLSSVITWLLLEQLMTRLPNIPDIIGKIGDLYTFP